MKTLKGLFIVVALFVTVSAFSQQTIAILPFSATEDGRNNEQLGKEAQKFLIGYIKKKQKHFKVTPHASRDVNVLLHKAGITVANFDDYTTKELADIVKADYIMIGTVDKSLEGSTSTNTGFASSNSKNNYKKTNTYGGSVSSTSRKYHATVYISVFTKDGTSVYDGDKGNVFIDETPDSWKNSIIWLLRHMPIYN